MTWCECLGGNVTSGIWREAQGHKAYPGLVSQALRGSKKTGAKRGRKPGATKKTASKTTVVAEVNVQGIKAVPEFVKLHGSADGRLLQSVRSISCLRCFSRM